MVKVKAVEEVVENFVTSAPTASIRYQRHLEKRGVRDPEKGSINYALGTILNSGLPQERSKEVLRDGYDCVKAYLDRGRRWIMSWCRKCRIQVNPGQRPAGLAWMMS